ncbi:hypothetical protein FRC15_010330 [Serendipita sp. 397]|nr:hypothetical protein FRC15_010330 [Serendipita sp. 397]
MSSATSGIPPVTSAALPPVVGSRSAHGSTGGNVGTFGVKSGLAQMLKVRYFYAFQ